MENITQEEKANKGNEMANKVNEFLINADQEETNLTLDCAKALLALDIEVKEIKNDQKEIKKEAKANGVSVQKVTKALNALKAAMKANVNDLAEQELIEEVLGNDVDVKTMVSELVRKD